MLSRALVPNFSVYCTVNYCNENSIANIAIELVSVFSPHIRIGSDFESDRTKGREISTRGLHYKTDSIVIAEKGRNVFCSKGYTIRKFITYVSM